MVLWEKLGQKVLLVMMVPLDGMVQLENGVIVETPALQVCQALRVPQGLLGLLVHLEMQDKEETLVLEALLDHLAELENVVCLGPKDLEVTRVTMETEVTEVRKATEASLAFRVFLALLVRMVNKEVLGSLVLLAQEVLLDQ